MPLLEEIGCRFVLNVPTAKLNKMCKLNTAKVIENLVSITFECHYKVEERSEKQRISQVCKNA